MSPRKRPRPGDLEESTNISRPGSLLQQFLAPTQKSWMTSNQNANQQPPSKPSRPRPTTLSLMQASGTASVPTGDPTQAATPTDFTRSENVLSASNQDPQTPSHPPSGPATMASTGSASTPIQPQSLSTPPALPSPAPSENGHRRPVVMDLEQDPPADGQPSLPRADVAANPAPQQPEVNARLLELAARFGGIDELEKQLGLIQNAQQQPEAPALQMSANNANIQPLSSPSEISPIHQQQSSNQSLKSELPQRSFGNMSSLMPVATSIDQQAAARPNATSRVQAFSDPLDNENLETYAIIVDQRRSTVMGALNIPEEKKVIDQGRLALLRDACLSRDIIYLVLHQIYCNSASLKLLPEQQKGVTTLQNLIVANNQLDGDSIIWFSRFPGFSSTIRLTSPKYWAAYVEAFSCLATLGSNWDQVLARCRAAELPPTVDLIEKGLGVKSIILQRAIFKMFLRWAWRAPQDVCFEHCEQLFLQTQNLTEHWKIRQAQISPAELLAEKKRHQNKLLGDYRQIMISHLQHLPGQMQASLQSRPSRDMPQPERQNPTSTQSAPVTHQILQQRDRSREIVQPPISIQRAQYFPLPSPQHNLMNARRPASTTSSTFAPPPPRRTMSAQQAQGINQPSNMRNQSGSPMQQINPPTSASRSNHFGNFGPCANLPTPPNSIGSPHPSQNWRPGATHATQTYPPGHQTPPNLRGDEIYSQMIVQETLPQTKGVASLPAPLLFPPSGYVRPPVVQPPDSGWSLHQAHLRDAYVFVDGASCQGKSPNILSYLEGFLMKPITINPNTSSVEQSIQVEGDLFKLLPRDKFDPLGGPAVKKASIGSRLLRLRCLKIKTKSITESEWAVNETEWPASAAILLNDQSLELRRKAEHGKDLAIDLTGLVVEGSNAIRGAFLRRERDANKTATYALGIEILTITNLDAMKQQVGQVDAQVLEQRVRDQLKHSDDEIQILSNDLVIRLSDPFTAQLVGTPVRGKGCTHYECFDLDVFLQTRKPDVWKPEQFKCPICSSDARPQSLLKDNWFVGVIDRLKDMGRADAKTIVVDEDVQWKVREEEVEGESGDGSGKRPRTGPSVDGGSGQTAVRRDSAVIELD